MKLDWSPKKRAGILCILLIVTIAVAFYLFLQDPSGVQGLLGWIWGIARPFVVGFIIAYLLWRPLRLLEKPVIWLNSRTGGHMKDKTVRTIGVTVLFVLVGALVVALVRIVAPQLATSISTLSSRLPGYLSSMETTLNGWISALGMGEDIYQLLAKGLDWLINLVVDNLEKIPSWLINLSLGVTNGLIQAVIGIAACVIMLREKEKLTAQLKKAMWALFPRQFNLRAFQLGGIVDDTFGRYMVGQLTDALIVGVVCFLFMVILQLPYALLISVIIAFTNIIPMLGPFIGAVPSALIVLMSGSPLKMLLFVGMILVLQQLDGNILAPRIIGSSTGISGIWVLFGVMVGGGVFGIPGIILSVPFLSVVFKIGGMFMRRWGAQRGKSDGSAPPPSETASGQQTERAASAEQDGVFSAPSGLPASGKPAPMQEPFDEDLPFFTQPNTGSSDGEDDPNRWHSL